MGLQARLLSVDDDIRPVIEFLSSLGLSDQQVKQVRRCQLQRRVGIGGWAKQQTAACCMVQPPSSA